MKKYYKAIKKALICKPKVKKEILEQLQNSVEEYIESHPDCTQSDIEAHFGSPKSIAEEFAALNGIDYKKRVKINKIIKISIIVILSLVLLYVVAVCFFVVVDNIKNPVYYYEIILND